MDRITYRSDDERREHCLSKGIDPKQHCCLDMAWFIANPVEWPSQGVNPVMAWIPFHDEYKISIPRGGHVSIPVRWCPWCGSKLPKSKRGLWYKALYEMGFEDPGNDQIPEEFNSDQWWRSRQINEGV